MRSALSIPSLVVALAASLIPARGISHGLDVDHGPQAAPFITNTQAANRLFRNDSGGSFAEIRAPPVTGTWDSEGSCWAEDNDGDLDLAISGGGNISVGRNRVYENVGAGISRSLRVAR